MALRFCLIFPLLLAGCEKVANEAGRAVGNASSEFAKGAMEKPMADAERARAEFEEKLRAERNRRENEAAMKAALPNGPRAR